MYSEHSLVPLTLSISMVTSLPQASAIARRITHRQSWLRRIGLYEAPVRNHAQNSCWFVVVRVDESDIYNEYQPTGNWNLCRDAHHIWIIFVKKRWTEDVGKYVSTIVIFRERALDPSETGVSTANRGQVAGGLSVPALDTGNRWGSA